MCNGMVRSWPSSPKFLSETGFDQNLPTILEITEQIMEIHNYIVTIISNPHLNNKYIHYTNK